MKEIVFSGMAVAPSPGIGDAFFDAFTTRHHVKVKSLHIDWGDSWNQLVQFGLSGRGPDVSEIA
jgi:hypothetical protein